MSGSSQGSSTSWVTYAVVGSTAAIAVAGLGYLAYSAWSDAESEDPAPSASDETAAARLKIARGIQMQSLASSQPTTTSPSLPVRPTPKANGTSKPTSTKVPSASSGGRKMCAQCGKPTSGLPLRCSGCKQVYYCSQECQRKAWPEHKTSCKSSSSGGTSQSTATATTPAPSQPAAAAQEPSGTPSKEATAAEEPKDFQSALAMYLEQQATANTDQLEASFETAVMLFVKGEYRAAITQLERVKEMSIERGNKGVQGEVYKWLGHAYNRLSEPSKAQVMFEEGSAYAKQNKLTRLEIDCLGGLGCMYRAQNNTERAVALLEEALGLAEVCKDEDSKASTLCNLGAALMQVDPKRALNCLHEAVTIREVAIERIHDSGERNGLATAVMEHANALVNLASALLVTKHLPEAEMCYVRALEVFELVEDVDKVCKVLINLANMKELQIGTAKARQDAVVYRKKLIDFMAAHGVRRVDSACSICLEPFDMQAANLEEGQELILLSCLHCLHNKCWEQWAAKDTGDGPVTCPTCKQPVPLYEG